MKKMILMMISVTSLFMIGSPAVAELVIGESGTLIFVENGWFGEGLAINHTQGIEGCPAPDNSFSIDKDHPSYQDLVSIALTAFAASSNVQLVVDKGNCMFGDRTRVVSIRLLK